jgi:hypothetical protein
MGRVQDLRIVLLYMVIGGGLNSWILPVSAL